MKNCYSCLLIFYLEIKRVWVQKSLPLKKIAAMWQNNEPYLLYWWIQKKKCTASGPFLNQVCTINSILNLQHNIDERLAHCMCHMWRKVKCTDGKMGSAKRDKVKNEHRSQDLCLFLQSKQIIGWFVCSEILR